MPVRPDDDTSDRTAQAAGPERTDVAASRVDEAEAALAERLKRLSTRLDAEAEVRKAEAVKSMDKDMTGAAKAMRLSADFIAGVVVGAGLGWVFDRVLGTSPWGLIVFLMLGFGAGVLNVLRTAGVAPKPGETDWKPKDR